MNSSSEQKATIYLASFDRILKKMGNAMLYPRLTNDLTIDFIRCMIPHHLAAIEMSSNLLRFSAYPPLVQIANNIMKVQQEEINEMQEIARTKETTMNTQEEQDKYFNNYFEIVNTMLNEMQSSARTNNINLDFTTEMIPHHEGAIKMCQNVLSFSIDPRLRALAQKIIQQQSEGVEQLKQIRSLLIRR